MIGKVTVWQMTPKQLAEYIEKHPIRPTERPTNSTFANIHDDYKGGSYREEKEQ